MPRLAYTILITFLIFIMFLDSAYADSDIKKLFTAVPWDKQLHFTWGFALTTTITALTGSLIVGISVTLLLEFVKEYIIDDFPDYEDIIYTAIGILFGCLVSDMLIKLEKTEANSSY